MNATDIKGIIFDFGNVLIDIDIPVTITKLEGILGQKFSDISSDDNNIFNKFERGQVSEELFLNHLIKHSPNNVQANEIVHCWNGMLLELPFHRLELLRALREKYKLYLLSNTNTTHIDWVRNYLDKKYDITDFEERYFDQVFYSYDMDSRKPERQIYEKTMEAIDLEPSSLLFFDDMPVNVAAANEAGLPALVHNPKTEIGDQLRDLGLI